MSSTTTTTTRPKRERPKALKLTDAAAARIREILADGKYSGVRVGVANAGCAGMTYTMEYADEKGAFDEEVEEKGVRLFIDAKAVMFLLGTEMDFRKDKMAARFVFNNPNQTDACGCGESVAITPAKHADGE